MKVRHILPLALALLLTGCATDALHQTHRDRYGNTTGTSTTLGDKQTHYDRYGNRTGSTTTRGGRQYHYDKYGNLTGTSTLPKKGAQ